MGQIDRKDGVISHPGMKSPCRVATTANITLSGEQTIDGVSVVDEDRVLVKNQTDQTENGIYEASTGAWSRAKDCDSADDLVNGSLVFVRDGTVGWYVCTASDPIAFGTDNITWQAASTALASASAFMQTVLDDADATTALATLGVAIAINSATEETSPANDDFVGLRDVSETADRKMTLSNVLTLMNSFTGLGAAPDHLDAFVMYDASASAAKKVTAGKAAVSLGYISGLVVSNNGSDGDHDIDIAAGIARSAGDTAFLRLGSTLTKQIDANWALGTDAGGFPSGLTLAASTWYQVFLITDSNGAVDAGFDTSVTAENLLDDSGGTEYRRVGWVLTDGSSNIMAFSAKEIQGGGVENLWSTSIQDVFDSPSVTTRVLYVLSAPPRSHVLADIDCADNSPPADNYFVVNSPVQLDQAPAAGYYTAVNTSDAERFQLAHSLTRVDNQSQIAIRASSADLEQDNIILTHGWVDARRS